MKFLLTEAVKKFGSKTAIVSSDVVLTFSQLNNCVSYTVEKLKEADFKEGMRVGMWGLNSVEYLVCLLALWKIKAVACLVSNRLPEDGRDKCFKLANFDKLMPSFEMDQVVSLAETDTEYLQEDEDFDLETDATIMFTSGSTGEPKAVLHSIANHYYSALGSNHMIPFDPGDRWLLTLPLNHVGGLSILFRSLLGGGAIVLPGQDENFTTAIDVYQPTHVSLVTTHLYRLLENESEDEKYKNLKVMLVGGSPIPRAMIEKALKLQWPIYVTYGLTEMSSQVATCPHQELRHKRLSSARVLMYRDIQISNEGEIMVRGETLFKGYVEGDQLIKPFKKGGWFLTGDRGKVTSQNELFVSGRKDNMFISGGENIQPEELERSLCQFDGIAEAIVVAQEDEEYGHRPVAFLKTNLEEPIDVAKIKSTLALSLPRFKVPTQFYEWPEDMVSAETGKTTRKQFNTLIQERLGELKLLEEL